MNLQKYCLHDAFMDYKVRIKRKTYPPRHLLHLEDKRLLPNCIKRRPKKNAFDTWNPATSNEWSRCQEIKGSRTAFEMHSKVVNHVVAKASARTTYSWSSGFPRATGKAVFYQLNQLLSITKPVAIIGLRRSTPYVRKSVARYIMSAVIWQVCHAETRGQSNLTKSASRGAHSPVRGHPRGSKVVPLNSWGRVSY